MLNKNNDIISISISDDLLKVAHIKGFGPNARVDNVVTRNITGLSSAELPKAIQASVGGMNAKKANVVCVIPPSQITTKNIEIPSVNEEEIKSIVNLQAGRHTPFSRDEIQIGYINIGVYNGNYTKVLLVIANRNVIKTQLTACEKVGLKVRKVAFAPEGIAGLYSSALGIGSNAAPTGIIDIGKKATNFVISFKGVSITSRSIPIGKQHLNSDPSCQNNLLDELALTIESYKNDDIEQLPASYIFTSEDENTRALQPLLQNKLGSNVSISPYVDAIKAGKSVLKKLAVQDSDDSLLDVIAVGATAVTSQVDLIPEEVLLQDSIRAQGKEVLTTMILGFITMILVIVFVQLKIFATQSFLNNLKKEYAGSRKQVAALEELTDKTKILQDYMENRMIVLDTINELYKSIPDEVYLTSIIMEQDGSISVQGVSEIASIVFNLGTKLKKSELFKSVEIKSTTSKKDRGKDATAFEISLNLNSSEDDKTDQTVEE